MARGRGTVGGSFNRNNKRRRRRQTPIHKDNFLEEAVAVEKEFPGKDKKTIVLSQTSNNFLASHLAKRWRKRVDPLLQWPFEMKEKLEQHEVVDRLPETVKKYEPKKSDKYWIVIEDTPTDPVIIPLSKHQLVTPNGLEIAKDENGEDVYVAKTIIRDSEARGFR